MFDSTVSSVLEFARTLRGKDPTATESLNSLLQKISIADQLRAAAFASDRRAVADILTENSDIPMLVEGFSFEPQGV